MTAPHVRLDCPLCGAVVHDAPGEPVPGVCPGCGARYGGGGDTPPDAAAAFLEHIGERDVPAEAFARGLFTIDAGGELGRQIAVTSDSRDGFYRWWVFALPLSGDVGTLVRRVPDSA